MEGAAVTVVSFTPVRQTPDILTMHLAALDGQTDEHWFYDDNDTPTKLLAGRTILSRLDGLPDRGDYGQHDDHHNWNRGAVARVSRIKNWALRHLLDSSHDWIFLIDSDVLAPPGLVGHLLEADTPVVAAIYWTDWGEGPRPNVWDTDQYTFIGENGHERFKEPGHHRVGGLGACTLVHRTVIEAGVNFNPVYGVSWWGEDRHFSVRANAADVPLVACSHLTPFHVYHDHQTSEAQEWLTLNAPSPLP